MWQRCSAIRQPESWTLLGIRSANTSTRSCTSDVPSSARQPKGADEAARRQQAVRQAIECVALHFTIKILFIKLIEDLARGGDSLRIIHTLFPQRQNDQMGGLFGYKLLAELGGVVERQAACIGHQR